MQLNKLTSVRSPCNSRGVGNFIWYIKCPRDSTKSIMLEG